MIGGTKQAEYRRALEVMGNIINKELAPDRMLMFLLYFLSDIEYTAHDMHQLAGMLHANIKTEV